MNQKKKTSQLRPPTNLIDYKIAFHPYDIKNTKSFHWRFCQEKQQAHRLETDALVCFLICNRQIQIKHFLAHDYCITVSFRSLVNRVRRSGSV